MDVHLIVPPYCIDQGGAAILPNMAMLPVGPLMVAGLLQQRGCAVTVTDLVFRPDWKKFLPQDQPDILLLSCHTARSIPICIAVLDELYSRWKQHPYIVLGGNICQDNEGFGIRQFAQLGLQVDAVVRGFTHTSDVIQKIMSKTLGDIRTNVQEPLPQPALQLLSVETQQHYRDRATQKYPMYAFGIGCSWSCKYCMTPMGQPWTKRALEHSLSEVQLAHELGYVRIWCVDNLIFTDPEAALEFDGEVARRGMTWSGMTRPELVHKLPLKYFQGFRALTEIAMGIESASGNILQMLDRNARLSPQQLSEVFAKLRKFKIATNAFVILDLPESNETDFWRLYELLKMISPTVISWSFYNPPVETTADPGAMGFYRWPLGCSAVPPERVIQQAMVLSGVWWDGYALDEASPFFEDKNVFGANFLGARRIIQDKSARSPIGDIWEVWQEEEP